MEGRERRRGEGRFRDDSMSWNENRGKNGRKVSKWCQGKNGRRKMEVGGEGGRIRLVEGEDVGRRKGEVGGMERKGERKRRESQKGAWEERRKKEKYEEKKTR